MNQDMVSYLEKSTMKKRDKIGEEIKHTLCEVPRQRCELASVAMQRGSDCLYYWENATDFQGKT